MWTCCFDFCRENGFSVTQSSESAGRATVSIKRAHRVVIRRKPSWLVVFYGLVFAEMPCNYGRDYFKLIHFYFYYKFAFGVIRFSVTRGLVDLKAADLKAKLSTG